MKSISLSKSNLKGSLYARKDVNHAKKISTSTLNSYIQNPCNFKKSNTFRINDSHTTKSNSNKLISKTLT